MVRSDEMLHLPKLPESLYPPRLEQTVIVEWQPFQELATRYKPGRKVWRRLSAVLHPSRRTLAMVGGAAVLFSIALSQWRVRAVLAAPATVLRQGVASRATLVVMNDFRMTPALWQMTAAGWTRDRDGFIRPGPLALFRPSLPLTDYRFEFLAQIEKKSVGWVFRARDPRNYYAMKFHIVEPGPRPLIALLRYPVIDGRRQEGVESHVPFPFHNNMPYRIQLEVRGNRFTTLFEGQVVDEWIDNRLPSGGVGFFAETGEAARLYWMRISRNTDFVGRLCATLARLDGPAGPQPPGGRVHLPVWGDLDADIRRTRRWVDDFLRR